MLSPAGVVGARCCVRYRGCWNKLAPPEGFNLYKQTACFCSSGGLECESSVLGPHLPETLSLSVLACPSQVLVVTRSPRQSLGCCCITQALPEFPSPYKGIGDFPCGSEGKAFACNAGNLGSIPGSGRSPGVGNGNPLQYFCLENPMDGGAW